MMNLIQTITSKAPGLPLFAAAENRQKENRKAGNRQTENRRTSGVADNHAFNRTTGTPVSSGLSSTTGISGIGTTGNTEKKMRMETHDLTVRYGSTVGVRNVSLPIYDKQVLALIGPSGCGKTTYLRALNRMHDLTRGASVTGSVLLDGKNIYDSEINPVIIRRRIGMVFQKPTPFPTMSIYDNVVAGLKLVGIRKASILDEVCERALKQAALFNEVKDRLKSPGSSLSGGQQQRLSIARALAVDPEVLLMDEPTSSLDPQSTSRIEDLIHELKQQVTIVIVTHNMQQAARVSDNTAFFYVGDLVEYGPTSTLFTNPKETRTEEYITGQFG